MTEIRNVSLRVRVLGAVLAGLVGCSLAVNTSVSGLACDSMGNCLAGYFCNAANYCVTPDQVANTCAACSPIESCVREQCVPSCGGSDGGAFRACPAGTDCESGLCTVLPRATTLGPNSQFGASCTADTDCTGTTTTGSRLFCLMPFGGHSNGFCTTGCSDNTMCGGLAPVCSCFPSESGDCSTAGTGASVCSPTSFVKCSTDGECGPSGLVCGVYITGASGGSRSVSACRLPIPGGAATGAACNPEGTARNPEEPCVNGLCVQSSPAGAHVCTTSCAADMDCAAFPSAGGLPATCLPVTVGGLVDFETYPHVRASMCVPGGVSTGCTATGTGATCHADAPHCLSLGGDGGVPQCVASCTDNFDSQTSSRCPANTACQGVDGGQYCFR